MSLSLLLIGLWWRMSLKFSGVPEPGARWGTEQGTGTRPLWVGSQWPQERKFQFKIETRSAPSWEPVNRTWKAATCGLWRSPWIGRNQGAVFQGRPGIVQTHNETWFIYLHSCTGLESYVEMTQFHIFVMLAKGQLLNRERHFGNTIFLRTEDYSVYRHQRVYICGRGNFQPSMIRIFFTGC